MARRWLLTVATACTLMGMYAVYAAMLRPLLELPAAEAPRPIASSESEPPLPLENVRVATEHLSHQPWAASAKYHLRTQRAFVYFNDWQPEGAEGRVRFKPFAMAWVDFDGETGAERVVTLVSESALVKFAGSYQMANPDPGRVVSAALQGRSQVAGPDGLKIDGHNFSFSEASAALWSDHPVRFAYAGNEGSAEYMQIDLIPQDGVPSRDRPHIFGVRTVRLSRRVKMSLQLRQKQEPLQLIVESENFDYDVPQRRAVYAKEVRAYRKTSPTEFDWIECDRMTVDFAPSSVANASSPAESPLRAGYQQLDRRLQFRRLHAERNSGPDRKSKPILTSMVHKLRAWADALSYDGERRTVALKAAEGVKIEQQANQLKTPEVTLTLGDGGRLAGAWCRGAGWLVHRGGDSPEILFAADWRQELRYQPDPETGLDLWELGDFATFRQPGQSTALGADHIRVWTTPPQSDGDASVEQQFAAATPKGVQPRRLAAFGNVVLISPRIEAQCQELEGWIDPPSEPEDGGVQTASATSDGGPSAKSNEPVEQPYQATADVIRVKLLARDDRSAPELAEIWTEGRVALRQPQPDGQSPRTMSGSGVHLENRGGKDQVVHITGKPAQLRDQGYALEAHDMHIDRSENRVWVNGPGALQLPIKTDLDGQPLREPHPLDVSWKERMSFDGTLATFTGNAVARLGDRQMTCRQLKVTLADRISFAESDRNAPAAQVATVYCRDDVTFRNLTYEQNAIIEIQEARVWELHVDRTTGYLHAQGPGFMQMWCRGQGSRAGLAPQQTAKANSPVELDSAEWEFTHVKFDGQMTGNLERRYSEFYDRVEILHGPVRQSKDSFTRDALPKGGGWMRCEVLRVMQQRVPDLQRNFVQVVGEGNAELEGRGYYANADQVVYDQSRGTYMLRAFGKRKAKFWKEGLPGEPVNPNQFQRGEVNRETGVLRVDGAVSGEGGR